MSTFDPEARERELRAQADSWDTTVIATAEPGDIPIVDIGPWLASNSAADLQTCAAALRDASEQVGFYQLVGHGLTSAAVASIFEQAGRFHALPDQVKMKTRMDRPDWPLGGVGYLPVGERKLPRRDKGNLNEAFLIKSDRSISSDDNQWLPDDDLPGFRAGVEAYGAAISDVAMGLLPVYDAALELDAGFFAPAFTDPFWRLRLTHYPPDLMSASDDFGINPHVDTTFFTLLLQNGPGLAIYSEKRCSWIEVPVVPDAIVVNTGELLRQWSNDRFLSARHFAKNSATESRYSIPLFFNANGDYEMVCLPTCHGPGNPPKYAPVSYLASQAAVQGE